MEPSVPDETAASTVVNELIGEMDGDASGGTELSGVVTGTDEPDGETEKEEVMLGKVEKTGVSLGRPLHFEAS